MDARERKCESMRVCVFIYVGTHVCMMNFKLIFWFKVFVVFKSSQAISKKKNSFLKKEKEEKWNKTKKEESRKKIKLQEILHQELINDKQDFFFKKKGVFVFSNSQEDIQSLSFPISLTTRNFSSQSIHTYNRHTHTRTRWHLTWRISILLKCVSVCGFV